MSKKTFKLLMIGVFASVLAGIFLQYKEYIFKPFLWFKPVIRWCWNFLISSHSLPGWVLLIVFLFAFLFIIVAVIYFLVNINKNPEPEYLSYMEDNMFGAIWRWQWIRNQISNIWCYCPRCGTTLVCDDHWGETCFRCENCNNSVITTLNGDKNQAIDRVGREIERRIKAGEYKRIITSE